MAMMSCIDGNKDDKGYGDGNGCANGEGGEDEDENDNIRVVDDIGYATQMVMRTAIKPARVIAMITFIATGRFWRWQWELEP